MALGSTTPPVNTENANQGMQAIDTQTVLMNGNHVQLLDVVSIFKGKLHAAADRHKVSDVADLEHLINLYGQSLRPHAGKFSLRDVSKVVRRYPQLAGLFSRIQIECVPGAGDTIR
ncbi:hypothetical protein CIHG_07302 [Coccidioides immitis H538.4]|uniref:Uncharacterized protein n=3 Tax=Coccidioides immitis TaxID=5501 RepID=A0A0J8TQF8_COCIT|nr:hypothetical protein CIRG_00637 [Coccidioides immitis RMSCC 2394]KMU75982.1 hypothetical protein CISG_05467 [Coccidioides immitis RMSCC 3703]KMU89495.1 hypothetical protein CIHG_07302 [Coccidioides immitis H538.4]